MGICNELEIWIFTCNCKIFLKCHVNVQQQSFNFGIHISQTKDENWKIAKSPLLSLKKNFGGWGGGVVMEID